MKDRIKKLIVEYDLTPSKFAELLGVQPSSISHLLSGRNNPSFDFITRVLSNFPKVNPDWLILGEGAIFRSNKDANNSIEVSEKQDITPPYINENNKATSTSSVVENTLHQSDYDSTKSELKLNSTVLPSKTTEQTTVSTTAERTLFNEVNKPSAELNPTESAVSSNENLTPENNVKTSSQPQQPVENGSSSSAQSVIASDLMKLHNTKTIETIVIFYADGTFKYYKPE